MKRLLFTCSICLVALAISAQPASKKHGQKHAQSSVSYVTNSDGHSLISKKHGSTDSYIASSDGHSLTSKKHGSTINYTASSDGHSFATKKHGQLNARFEEESSIAQNMEENNGDNK